MASAAMDCAVPGGEARQDKVRVAAIAKLIVCVLRRDAMLRWRGESRQLSVDEEMGVCRHCLRKYLGWLKRRTVIV